MRIDAAYVRELLSLIVDVVPFNQGFGEMTPEKEEMKEASARAMQTLGQMNNEFYAKFHFHIQVLEQEEYVVFNTSTPITGGGIRLYEASIPSMQITAAGTDFLARIQPVDVWEKVESSLVEKGKVLSFEVIKALAAEAVKGIV